MKKQSLHLKSSNTSAKVRKHAQKCAFGKIEKSAKNATKKWGHFSPWLFAGGGAEHKTWASQEAYNPGLKWKTVKEAQAVLPLCPTNTWMTKCNPMRGCPFDRWVPTQTKQNQFQTSKIPPTVTIFCVQTRGSLDQGIRYTGGGVLQNNQTPKKIPGMTEIRPKWQSMAQNEPHYPNWSEKRLYEFLDMRQDWTVPTHQRWGLVSFLGGLLKIPKSYSGVSFLAYAENFAKNSPCR